MVSKKKRPPPALDSNDTNAKKTKLHDGAGTSGSVATSAAKTSGASKRTTEGKAKGALDPVVPVMENNTGGCDDFPHWPQADLLELMKRMEGCIPPKDILSFASRAEKLDWDTVSFGDHSAQDCKETWSKIQKRLRKFRLLKELLEDAKVWVSKPWTNFYRSQKQNRHPDMPRRPLSSYMLFYMDKKDRVARENPGFEMTAVSKYIAELYKNLPAKKKQKYSELAAKERKEYEEKLDQFYQEHPELVPKQGEKSEGKSSVEVGPKKPKQPFKLFFEDKLKRHKGDQDFDRSSFLEKCKEQWRTMPDKKKVIWINWALEEENRYAEELKAYMSENPEFVPSNVRTVLTKEEKTLRERVAGKPEKPPNSGYSLFSRLMLASDHIKDIEPKTRMAEISRLWKCLPEIQKKKYQEQVNHMLDQYKLEYATYLESLPEDKRKEELQKNQPKQRKPVKAKATSDSEAEKKSSNKKSNKQQKNENSVLLKGEPEPPPRDAYQLFLMALLNDKSQSYTKKEAPKLWQMLADKEKLKYHKKLKEIKAKYIEDYSKFLKSLSQEELKEYTAKKESVKQESADESEESGQEDDSNSSDDDDDDDDDDNEDSGSDDSSSDSDSGSSDSSDSNDGDSKNSEDSSSSVSDSD